MGTVFDPIVLHEIVRSHIETPLEVAFDSITAELASRYPGHIHTGPRHWIFSNAGGAMGQMTLLHSSLTEYLLLFGTPIGTSGHSGRYNTDVWDIMIAGEMWCYDEGELARTEYLPGDMAFLGEAKVKGYRAIEDTWMLEYARGPVWTMLPFGLADTVFSTLDFRTVARTFWDYGKLVAGQLLKGKI